MPDNPSPSGDSSWIVQGWAVAIAALQRGQLCLHAATGSINGSIVAVAGERGAGKSTTALGLRARGHQHLVDDVTLVEMHNGGAHVSPYHRYVHLLPDAAAVLGIDHSQLPVLAGGRSKVAFTPEIPDFTPRRIDAVVVLSPDASGTEVEITEIQGADRAAHLIRHTHREALATLIMGETEYFKAVAGLADACRVLSLRRPRGPISPGSLAAVLDALESVVPEHVDSAASALT